MDYTEAFEQIDIFRIHLIEEEKSTLTVQKITSGILQDSLPTFLLKRL